MAMIGLKDLRRRPRGLGSAGGRRGLPPGPGAPALAYDARYVTAEPCGIGQVCLQLLRGLAGLEGRPDLLVLVNSRTSLPAELWERDDLTFVHAPWDPRGLLNQLCLPGLLRRHKVRLLHSLDSFAPVAAAGIRQVVNVHDLIPLACKDPLARSKKARFPRLWRAWLRCQCDRARVLVTVSRHSASDLVRVLGVDPGKVRVIYNPVREWEAVEPVTRFRQRFDLRGRVVSYVGRQEPYKNLVALVRAMRLVVDRLADDRVRLVVAGSPDDRYPEAGDETRRLGLEDKVVFTGYVSDASLGALYRTSDVFVFPSRYEGFGMPPVEAMRFGTPVIAGRRTATPEVLGQAAHYVDTEDPRAIAGGILAVLADPALAARLRQAGLRQAARYSGHRAVRHYRQLYAELLGEPLAARR